MNQIKSIQRNDILFGMLIFVVTTLGLYLGLQSTGPYFPDMMKSDDPYMVRLRTTMFATFAIPLGSILALSAVAASWSRRRDKPQNSPAAFYAFGWPIVMSVLLWHELLIFLVSIIVGAIIGLIGLSQTVRAAYAVIKHRRNYIDLLAIPLNFTWLICFVVYVDHWTARFIW